MNKEKAKEIISHLNIPMNAGIYTDDGIFNGENDIYCALDPYGYDYEIGYGLTKLVIVPEDEDFVIKTPFYGTWRTNTWDEDSTDPEFCRFEDENAMCGCSSYCEAEYEKTAIIKASPYGMFVPNMEFVCETDNGRPFYIQEKVEIFTKEASNPSRESLKTALEEEDEYKFCLTPWRATVIDFYGEDTWKNFVDWQKNENLNLFDDMHSGNYGYRFDGSPVMFDISGVGEEEVI